MRASELEGKEVINIQTGARYGVIKRSELLLNLGAGMVESLVVIKKGWNGREIEVKTIAWKDIRTISDELILFAEPQDNVAPPG